MRLSNGKAILLFRFHKEPNIARERIKILKYYNPDLPIYALYGGQRGGLEQACLAVDELVENVWSFPGNKNVEWKWQHADLMLKAWYRDFGHSVNFDFLYSYEYDLLTLAPLIELYPDITDDTLALSAYTKFTDKIENTWFWTAKEPFKTGFKVFNEGFLSKYGIKRQQYICLGTGPVLPKAFLDRWSKTKDGEDVHDQIVYPAYAEAFGFKAVDNGMHPGFRAPKEKQRYFNNENMQVPLELIQEQMEMPDGRRAFHPVKYMITLEEINDMINAA
ncbi:hypothetical protein BH23PAT1_BH23PAT1_1440 [soil metagenome]